MCSVSFVTLMVLVVTWVQDGFRVALAGFGTALFFAAAAMLFTPVVGGLVSLGNRSWYGFKIWSASGAIALLLNVLFGLAAIGAAHYL